MTCSYHNCEEYKQRENNLYLLDAIEIVKGGDRDA